MHLTLAFWLWLELSCSGFALGGGGIIVKGNMTGCIYVHFKSLFGTYVLRS